MGMEMFRANKIIGIIDYPQKLKKVLGLGIGLGLGIILNQYEINQF